MRSDETGTTADAYRSAHNTSMAGTGWRPLGEEESIVVGEDKGAGPRAQGSVATRTTAVPGRMSGTSTFVSLIVLLFCPTWTSCSVAYTAIIDSAARSL